MWDNDNGHDVTFDDYDNELMAVMCTNDDNDYYDWCMMCCVYVYTNDCTYFYL